MQLVEGLASLPFEDDEELRRKIREAFSSDEDDE